MIKCATIFGPEPAPLRLAVLVLPHASILSVASVLDPMRAANRHLGQEAFRWRVISAIGGPVALTCGIDLPAQAGPFEAGETDVMVVIAGYRQSEVADGALIGRIARVAGGFRAVIGIDAGSWILARAGLLDGHHATVHWEDFEDFATTFPRVDLQPDRFVISGNRVTAGGAAPAADLMLHLIQTRHGPGIARQVAGTFITEGRAGTLPQMAAPSAAPPRTARDPRVVAALGRMELRLDQPETVAESALALGLSRRRLEGLFATELGCSPAAASRDLRLQAARRMIEDTRHSLHEVALRSGFGSQAALSRAFRRRFGHPPSALRRKTT